MAEVARQRGWSVESLDYQGMADADARVRLLVDWCSSQPAAPVLVGSSMGGFVALRAAAETAAAGLFLLAPALYVAGYREMLPAVVPRCPITIVHGWHDDVIPWQDSVKFAAGQASRLLLVSADHRLTAALDEISNLFGRFLDECDPGCVKESAR
jgi:alpha/beta superfamily hydrolase